MLASPDLARANNLDTDVISSASFPSICIPAGGRPLGLQYLRAVHDYNPSPLSSPDAFGPTSTSKTIAIRSGDIVLVHLTHANSWADGTVLNSGLRGWLPTNYCEPFDHEFVRHILHALSSLWETHVLTGGDHRSQQDHRDDLQAFVYGVRSLLERTSCLHRHDPIVLSCSNIHRARKALLSDLAALVESHKSIVSESLDRTSEHPGLPRYEEYVLEAFRVATRSVRFLDVWKRQRSQLPSPKIAQVSTTPGATFPGSTLEEARSPPAVLTAGRWTERQTPIKNTAVRADHPPRLRDDGMPPAMSVSHGIPTGTVSRPDLLPSPSCPAVTCPAESPRQVGQDSNSTVEKLHFAHDRLKSQTAGLLCLPPQSLCSSNVSPMAKKTVDACDDLAIVLRNISAMMSPSDPPLNNAINTLTRATSKLASVATQIANARSSDRADTIIDLARRRSLIRYAATCQSCASLCTAQAQKLLKQDGDVATQVGSLSLSATLRRAPGPAAPPFYSTGFGPFVSADSLDLSQLLSPIDDAEMKQYTFETVSSTFGLDHSPPGTVPKILSSYTSDPFGIDWSDPSTEVFETVNASRPASAVGVDKSHPSTPLAPNDAEDAGPADLDAQRHPNRRPVITIVTGQLNLAGVESPDESDPSASKSSFAGLIQSKDGKILGGTLSALVECMTSDNFVPEPSTFKTFFLSFRSFTTAPELSRALIERYAHGEQDRLASTPTRLRVLNMFRHWLEGYWNNEKDASALPLIRDFACDRSIQLLPSARSRLLELVEKAPMVTGCETPPLDSTFGLEMTRSQSPPKVVASHPAPQAMISKTQMTQLLNNRIKVSDLEPLEVARQLTLIVSRFYCAVTAEELDPSNLNDKDRKSSNIRTLARISTDLANMVTQTILYGGDVKKRSTAVRHWIRVAQSCAELCNFDSLMAILCALNSSPVSRLKRTWALVPLKQREQFRELGAIVDTRKNYGALRQKLKACRKPCLPFVGMFLSDLTFVDAGNPNTRTLQCGGDPQGEVKCINFDKHARTVRIIEQFQMFQSPYNLLALPNFQDWLSAQFDEVRRSDGSDIQEAYQQSLRIEPREDSVRSKLAPKMPRKESVPFWKQKAHVDGPKAHVHQVLHKQSAEPRAKHAGIAV